MYQLFPEPPLDMGVTEGSDYGDVEGKQEIPESDTVKCEMMSPGAQSETSSNTIKYDVLQSGSISGADSDMVECGSESGVDNDSLKCDMLPSGSNSGAANTEPQCHTGTLTGNKESKKAWG